MYPASSSPQAVTLYDYVLQAKRTKAGEARPEAHTKSSLAGSEGSDCFVAEAQSQTATALKARSSTSRTLPFGTLIDLESKDLLPGFQKRPAFNPQNIQVDDLVLCHMTGYLSPTGTIPSNLENGYSVRPTTHFSLNHPVGEVPGQATLWKSKKYCILTPMKDGLKLNGKPAGCLEVDTYWDKSFNYNSRHAILIVQKEDVPKGQAEVLSPASQGLPEHSSVLVLATCKLPHDAANQVISKMGRTLLKPGAITWGDYGNLNPVEFSKDSKNTEGTQRIGFKRFLRQHHLTEMLHSMSPYWQYQGVLIRIQALQLINQGAWQYNETDYKTVLLQKLQQLRQAFTPAQQQKLKCAEIEDILQAATKPSEAIEPIKAAWGIANVMEPAFYADLQGKATFLHTYPDPKKAIFRLHDVIFEQNLSEEDTANIQKTKTDLLGAIPIYSEASRPKGPDLKAMYLDRLFQQENRALLALLKDTCQNPPAADPFSAKKERFQKIRSDFWQKINDMITGRDQPLSYRDLLTQNLPRN